ncbi:MAG: hypothetical protein KC912_03280 [Proteobacteria bacterium]|nr:hypothetical protein [Pseudomonadota bacterium]
MTPERQALLALAHVISNGATDATIPWLREIPGLETFCALSEDERLAEHERVLGRGVFAYESVFTRDDALRAEGLAAEAYARHGLSVDEPNHLGNQLALYAQTGDLTFVAEHLARWAVPALVAIERQGGPFYPFVGSMVRELLGRPLNGVAVALPETADPLDNDKTGLRRLSEHLLVPVKSAWFLSRGDILRLASAAECPCGFGSRTQMLEAFFRTAVEHERLPAAVDVLLAELAEWRQVFREQAPAWDARAQLTEAVLKRLAAGVAPAS